MDIAMIGTGYVGLVSGVCLADIGHRVVCVDRDEQKIARLREGHVPIYEPGLEELMKRNVEAGRLTFTRDLAAALSKARAVFIGVGTPPHHGDGRADTSQVLDAARQIAAAAGDGIVVVTKSTVPIGTNRRVAAAIREVRPELDFDIASNPEFLREGAAVEDFMRPDRLVVGVDSDRAARVMAEIYRPLNLSASLIVTTDPESAEMIKYASNAFLATKITFINEVAHLCERTGADVKEVSRGIGLDERIGDKFLRAGPGFGGSCFSKDARALMRIGQELAAPMTIVESVVAANIAVKRRMVDKLREMAGGSFNGVRVAVLGVTFKPGTDDMRDAPALDIVPAMIGGGADVTIVDPQGRREGEALLPGAAWSEDPYAAVTDADLVAILTEWNEFANLDLARLAGAMRHPRMADLRNVYLPVEVRAAGFEAYDSTGHGRFGGRLGT